MKTSLTKLKVKAFNPDFSAEVFARQKFISKKEKNPINSHPKNNVKKLLAKHKKIIEATKKFKIHKKLISSRSN